jgi:small-conductance mechanosensitive channel
MTRRLIFIIGIVIAVSQLGVDVGPLLAAIGAAVSLSVLRCRAR